MRFQARAFNNTEPVDGTDVVLNEGKYNDLTDGRYEKTIYVKTWRGRTVSLETDLDHAVEAVKRQLEAKTGIPKDQQHLASGGKVLTDKRTLKDYCISGGETIEMSALSLGGMKNKSLSPAPMRTDREKKRKESEPYIDVRGLEEEKPEPTVEGEAVKDKVWIKNMMKELKERTDDVSDSERSMTTVQLEMKEVKVNMNKVAEAISKMSDDNHTRDRKFEELIKRINEGLYERDLKTDKKIEGLEKQIDTKIEEKITDLETRISAKE